MIFSFFKSQYGAIAPVAHLKSLQFLAVVVNWGYQKKYSN